MGQSTAVINGKEFGLAIREFADQADASVWIDRHVDHSAPIDAGQVGPTVYMAMKQIAQTRECVVMPIAGVVLVGRPEWVDATATSIGSIVQSASVWSTPKRIDVQWSEATTPNDSLSRIFDAASMNPTHRALDHDLWPAQRWKSIDPAVAIALVLAQFDLTFASPSLPKRLATEPIDVSNRYAQKYDLGAYRTKVLAVIRRKDRSSSAKTDRGLLEVTATASAHRMGIDEFFTTQAKNHRDKNRRTPVSLDTNNVSLNLLNTPAIEIFEKLASATGRACVIDSEAKRACEKMVSLEAKETSFRKLATQIAEQISDQGIIKAIWSRNSLTISAAPKVP
ncbi:hypothetical protein [Planctomycetes bacterium CA13]